MYNFNEFCKSINCSNYKELEMTAGHFKFCELQGLGFYIVKWPEEGCLHQEAIIAAKDKAKEQYKIIQILKNPGVGKKKLRNMKKDDIIL